MTRRAEAPSDLLIQGAADPIFDSYLIVDWSAAARPKRGADSIWWALIRRDGEQADLIRIENPPTRAEAEAALRDVLQREWTARRRLLAGFDFPFGYPSSFVEAVLGAAGDPPWRRLWAQLETVLEDGPRNATNRFAAAGRLNASFAAEGPFWGNGGKADIAGLGRKKPRGGYGAELPPEHRLTEIPRGAAGGPRPKSVWQLSGAGSVGSQALTGLPVLERLRRDPRRGSSTAVWPFETGLEPGAALRQARIVLAEVYPSLLPVTPAPGEPKDAAQVRSLGRRFAELDAAGALAPLFRGAAALSPTERRSVCREEGWILGVGHETTIRGEPDADRP